MINVFEPTTGPEEARAVSDTLASRWLGAGPRAREFKAAWAKYAGVEPEKMVALHNCTAGLFAAVARFTRPGDVVAVPAIHFIGAGNAVLAQGRRLALCDVDPFTLNLDPTGIPETAMAVVTNHYGGIPCDIDDIPGDFFIIEDAACAPASTYRGRACGTLADIGLWSFDAMKLFTSGDGGMAWLRHPDDAEWLNLQSHLGLESTHGVHNKEPGAGWWEYRVKEHGYLSEMNDVAAAVGLVQLGRLPDLLARRAQVCGWYDAGLAGLDWLTTRPRCPDDRTDSYYFYWIQCGDRDRLALYLRGRGIYTTFKYWPLHYAYGLGGSLPGAEQAARTTLLLPCHANLTESDVNYIIDKVRDFQ